MKIKLTLLFALSIFSSMKAISFRDYYHEHEEEVNDAVAEGSLLLSGKDLTDLDGFNEIPKLAQLQFLDLSGNQLADIPAMLGNLTQLQELYLDNNQIRSIPETIVNLIQLRDLLLSNNQLTKVPVVIGDLPQLQLLDLFNNPIPTPEQLQTELRLVRHQLSFKSREQYTLERAQITAIKEGNEMTVRRIYKMFMTGRVEAPGTHKINMATIHDDESGNNLLHLIIQSASEQVKTIRSELSKIMTNPILTQEKQKLPYRILMQQIFIERLYSKIFGILTQFGGPNVQRMLLTRNKNGDDVLAAAIGCLGPTSLLVKAISQYEYIPTPIGQHARPFLILTRAPIVKEEDDEKEMQVLANQRNQLQRQQNSSSSVPQPATKES